MVCRLQDLDRVTLWIMLRHAMHDPVDIAGLAEQGVAFRSAGCRGVYTVGSSKGTLLYMSDCKPEPCTKRM